MTLFCDHRRSPHPLPPNAPRPPPAQLQTLMGGELQISIVPETSSSSNTQSSAQLPLSSQPFSLSSNHTSSSKSSTSAIDKVKEALQSRLKLKGARPSDTVEKYRFEVSWRPQQGALGVFLPPTLWESTEEWKIVCTKISLMVLSFMLMVCTTLLFGSAL